jgi:hypothetical protein
MRALPFLLTLVMLSACSAERMRRHTYPPDFHYISRDEIRGTMGELAVRMAELEDIMTDEDEPAVEPEEQERIIELLAEMRQFSLDLKRGSRSNHPRIDRYAPELQKDLARALEGARSTPPNYYYAGQVPGACEYCHVPRHVPPKRAPPPSS